MSAMGGSEQVAQFVHDITWEALPVDVQRKVKMCLLDALGATLSGTLTRISRLTAEYAAQAWKGDEATILWRGLRATAAGAAFANGYAANGLDIDDCGKYNKGHPGAQIFPTALAVAEKLDKSGREMLTAMVVGYEVAHRTGRCWHDHHTIYQACGSWGAVANAAVTAHLMALDETQIRHALGIAEYQAPNLPMMRDVDHPAMVKHGIGWGAMTGIIAAELAVRGFTGIPSILGFERYQDWVTDIGEHYIMVDGVIFKEYACCGWAHAALDATRQLVQRHNIHVDDIVHIRVEGFHEVLRLGTQLPTSTEEAQFNTAWPLAVFLLDGEVGPWQILEARFSDERAVALINKIELVESDELSELTRLRGIGDPRGKYASSVEITLKNGRKLSSGVMSSGLEFGQNWDAGRVERKFRWLVSHVLPERQIDEVVEMVWGFDRVSHVAALTNLVQRGITPEL
jgi:2-methylcitrate dehydratase PrpD